MTEQSPITALIDYVREALAPWPKTDVDAKSVVMGIVSGLRVARHHPEYAVALGDQLQAHFAADAPGEASWPDDLAKALPEHVPLSQVSGNGRRGDE
jgi:hypothetical protein